MNNKQVFKHRNQDICEIFNRAEHPRKVMVVVLDYAKQTHTVLICDGTGDSLKAAFPVENSSEGLRFLQDQIKASLRRHAIPDTQVVIGGEDCGSFSLKKEVALSSGVGVIVLLYIQDFDIDLGLHRLSDLWHRQT